MKPNAPIDVADFFKQQLHYQEITPPENIWSNIESEIPTYATKPTWSWWIFNSIALVVVFSIATYLWIQNHSTSSKPKATLAYKQNTAIDMKKPSYIESPVYEQNTEQNNLPKKNTNISLPLQVQQTVYYIEATTTGKLDKIEILDSLNKIKKSIINPVPNNYGFYEMNIDELKPGRYTIVFYRKDGSIVHRHETFQ